MILALFPLVKVLDRQIGDSARVYIVGIGTSIGVEIAVFNSVAGIELVRGWYTKS